MTTSRNRKQRRSRWPEPVVGQTFGRLSVTGPTVQRERSGRVGVRFVPCHCSCGTDSEFELANLISGHTQSCGCYRAEAVAGRNRSRATHGLAGHPLYGVWNGMKQRCSNPMRAAWDNYGGRGITVCPEWNDSFKAFYDWALANGYEDGLTIERVDFNAGYAPANCTWIPLEQQAWNRRNNRLLKAWKEVKHAADWARDSRAGGATGSAICARIDDGWAPEEAISAPNNAVRSDAFYLTAFNETKLGKDWAGDPRAAPDLTYKRLWSRVNTDGWAPEDAITTPLHDRDGFGLVAWGEPKLIVDWENDPRSPSVSHKTISARLAMGWTPEKAISTPVRDGQYTIGDVTMGIKEWMKDPIAKVGSYRTLARRLKEGWDFYTALTTGDGRANNGPKPKDAST